ncbi:tripartite tricarboxylate transporter permease [Acuticoccus mangrovi]|uniref:Tripartite tricarboxylate transporter permease n=1 Tax=Acuticoccus mangrovi TaxID=2796142 RepID=A0A934IFN8_9HYPH|nr:tripartite tricarboxylate transporter permease [Acuticoccus mangrovi]MBJ3774136.1 tripartite tricarboxylate transporter permease [Acuticoccus mangrovi]
MPTDALAAVFTADNLTVIVIATLYGTFVGAMPGLTATMAVALLVPFTYFMDPVPAISAITATTTTAIFAGDIAGALLRMPGTPASAAYVDDSFRLSQEGSARKILFVSLLTAAIGGIVGVAILALAAPQLARFAIGFSSFENFWLATLGITCAILAGSGTVAKNFASLFLGLFVASIGIDVAVGHPRFTFGNVELYDGVSFIPAMIGLFAMSEVLRNARAGANVERLTLSLESVAAALSGAVGAIGRLKRVIAQSSILGTLIGALPGAGADIAAWIAYALAKRGSKTPERFGKGSIEGIAAGGSANNAGVAGAWTPALVFGIPGDSVTAIAIGVLFMKGLTPGPQIFTNDPTLVGALFGSFFVANIVMVFTGGLAILAATMILKVPRTVLMPMVLLSSLVGAYAITGSTLAIWIVLVLGIAGFFMEENGIPMAPAILGIVLGRVLEDNFMVSMMKSQGDLVAFFERPVAAVLGALTLFLWALLLIRAGLQLTRGRTSAHLTPEET